jgi:hypothetical protein
MSAKKCSCGTIHVTWPKSEYSTRIYSCVALYASRHAPGDDLQRLRKEDFRHVVCAVGDDLVEASGRRKARSGWVFAAWRVVIFPGFFQLLVRGIFLAERSQRHRSSGGSASAVLVFEPPSRTGMASADLMLLSQPLRNIEPMFTALTAPTALIRRSLIAALAVSD